MSASKNVNGAWGALLTRRQGLRHVAVGLVMGATAPFALAQAQVPGRAPQGRPEQSASLGKPSVRLISLSGGMTEVVYRLGLQRLLVGTDTTSIFPAEAMNTPKVGYMRTLSAEGVLSLKPSAVLGTHEVGPPQVLAQLRDAGVAIRLVRSDHSFEEVLAKVTAVAEVTGHEQAGMALIQELALQWQQTSRRLAAAQAARPGRKPRAMFVMGNGGKLMAAGQGTAAHAMLAYAGADNALAQMQGYKSLSSEAMVAAQPDIIVSTSETLQAQGGAEHFWQQGGLSLTPAGRRQQLVSMDTLYLLGFGTRLPQAVESLARALGTLPA